MNQDMITTDDGKKVPAPRSVAAWANSHGVNVMAAEGLHSKLRRLFNRTYIVPRPAADTVRQITESLTQGSTSCSPLRASIATWTTCWFPTC